MGKSSSGFTTVDSSKPRFKSTKVRLIIIEASWPIVAGLHGLPRRKYLKLRIG